MPDDRRFRQSDFWKRFLLINKEVFDALVVLALLASIGYLVYLQLRNEGKLPLSNSTPPSTVTLTSRLTEARTPTLVPPASTTQTPIPTRTSTVTPTPTMTSRPTTTSVPGPTLTAALVPNSGTQLPVDVEIKDGIERGDQLVQAIEAYTQAKGFYPAALEDLVPDYLPAIPVTITSQPFFYRVFERTTVMSPEIYWVAFRVVSQSHVTCTYFRRLQYWDCNFASP